MDFRLQICKEKRFDGELFSKKLSRKIVLLSRKGASNFNKLFLNNIEFNQLKQIKFACLSENIAKELSSKIKFKFFPNHPTLSNLKSVITQNE